MLHTRSNTIMASKRGAHACDRVAVDVTTSSPSLLMRFFSCIQTMTAG